MAVVIGDSAKRLDLLVIPPESNPASASVAMTKASAMGNTLSGPETLRSASLSTADVATVSGAAHVPVAN